MQLVKTYNRNTSITSDECKSIASFLYEHLDEYGDPQVDIEKAIEYVFAKDRTPGGILIVAQNGDDITGVVVVNKTGMSKYIPENILVYIATHKKYRGIGIGKMLMTSAIENTEGDIALHVEHNNPAKKLYEKLGFQNKYLEMRLKK